MNHMGHVYRPCRRMRYALIGGLTPEEAGKLDDNPFAKEHSACGMLGFL